MRDCLLDSHVLLWSFVQPSRIRPSQREALYEAETIYVSVATVWELEIKRNKGNLDLPDRIWERARGIDYRFIQISTNDAENAARLPRYHDDPFDRMIIAQAQLNNSLLITSDKKLLQYDVDICD